MNNLVLKATKESYRLISRLITKTEEIIVLVKHQSWRLRIERIEKEVTRANKITKKEYVKRLMNIMNDTSDLNP